MAPTAAQRRAALGSAARWRATAGRLALALALLSAGEAEAQQRRGRRRAPAAEEPAAAPPAEAAPAAPTGPVLGPELPPAAVGEGTTGQGSGEGRVEGQAAAPSAPAAGAGPAPPREAEDETYDRLFGAEPAGEAGENGEAAPKPAPKPPSLPFESPVWVWAVIVGLGLAWVAGKVWERRRVVVAPASLRVISSTPLGRDGHISVVEVKDADGALRRMLVGHGGGAPRLIAELDGLREFGAVEVAAAPPPLRGAEPERAAASARASEGERLSAAGRSAEGERAGPPSLAQDPPSRGAEAGRAGGRGAPPRGAAAGARPLAPRSDLIAEVLAERGEDEQDAVDDPPDRPSGAYTFRGLLG